MSNKKASEQPTGTAQLQLDFEFYHVIKLSYYLPKNYQERKDDMSYTCCWSFNLYFLPVSPAYQINHYNYLLFGHCSSFLHRWLPHSSAVSLWMSMYHAYQGFSWDRCPLSSPSRKFYKLSSVSDWMVAKWKSRAGLMYKAAFFSANPQGIDTRRSVGGHTLAKVVPLGKV